MPHIHTKPNQHDMTVSMYIIRQRSDGEWLCLVHMHKKLHALMQPGGHIEVDETPWQAVAHELREETGYELNELQILQPTKVAVSVRGAVVHPVPLLSNTHTAGSGPHYHSDACYAFVAHDEPCVLPAQNESADLRWMTLHELKNYNAERVLGDVIDIYESILTNYINMYHPVSAESFSLKKPTDSMEFPQQMMPFELIRFGNPLLRKASKRLSVAQIRSTQIQQLIANIRYTNQVKQYGVGLAAPQVGKNVALSVIGIKPTPTRPRLKVFEQVIINPSYEGIGELASMWEGCQSCGSGDDTLYAKVPRYRQVKAVWFDEHAKRHQKVLHGFVAHVFQHETDHLQGILFVDRVTDSTTYMMGDEYRKRIAKTAKH